MKKKKSKASEILNDGRAIQRMQAIQHMQILADITRCLCEESASPISHLTNDDALTVLACAYGRLAGKSNLKTAHLMEMVQVAVDMQRQKKRKRGAR